MKNTEKLNQEEVVVEETEMTKEGGLDKVKEAAKKYGKRIAIGAGILAVGIGAFALGRRSKSEDYQLEDEESELDYVEGVESNDEINDLTEESN